MPIKAKEIRRWRPSRWSDVIGAGNRVIVTELQRAILEQDVCHGVLDAKYVFIAPTGGGKTSTSRLLMKAACCEGRDPHTVDPCNRCPSCASIDELPATNGDVLWVPVWEHDCSRMNRPRLLEELSKADCRTPGAVYFNETHNMHEKYCMQSLQAFCENYQGLVIFSILEDSVDQIPESLAQRFEEIKLVPPTTEEIVELFLRLLAEWQIDATEELVHQVVQRSGRVFRECLRVFAKAAAADRTLTAALVERLLPATGQDSTFFDLA